MHIEDIIAMDSEAQQGRLKNIAFHTGKGGRPKDSKNAGTCPYPGCGNAVVGCGFCSTHRGRHYNDNLLKIDHSAFPFDEIFELYMDVFAIAEKAGVSVNEAVTWLIAEGVNSYERRGGLK